jgi:hypothetical protein
MVNRNQETVKGVTGKIYLTEGEVSEMVTKAKGTLRNDRFYGRGIPYIKYGRAVRYDLQDVIAFMERHRIEPRN